MECAGSALLSKLSMLCVGLLRWTFIRVLRSEFSKGEIPKRLSCKINALSTGVLQKKYPIIMKLGTPQFQSIFTPELKTLKDIFLKYGHELRIAGGAVRDLLMNKTPHDLDFATTATPDEMKEMFTTENIRMINVQGEKHGTITPRINDKENFEVTTLRIDVVTDGRHAEVEFTTDWKLDANRRDLTINSMFLGLDGTVYDYFSGYQDLVDRRVVFVGEPETRIQEDYLRILRYFRFYGRIAEGPSNHDSDTLRAIRKNAAGLKRISGERIWSELRKILEGNYAGPLIKEMLEQGIAPFIGLPEESCVEEFDAVYSRNKKGELRGITLLTSLFKTQDEVMTFHTRCKLSSFERDLAFFIVLYRNEKPSENPLKEYKKIIVSTKLKVEDVKEYVKELLKYKGEDNLIKDFCDWNVPRFPVNGTLLKEKGVPPGKVLGSVLQELKKYWIEKDFVPDSNDLLQHLPVVLSELGVECKK